MFVIPILERTLQQREVYTLKQFWMLLERNGTHLIEVADAAGAREFAETNGLEILRERLWADCLFLEIRQTPSLAEFYTWDETPPGTQPMREVWRPFLWASTDNIEDPLGIHRPLYEIELAAGHSAGSILATLSTGGSG